MFRKTESTAASRLKIRESVARSMDRSEARRAFVGEVSSFIDTNRGQVLAIATLGVCILAAGHVQDLPL